MGFRLYQRGSLSNISRVARLTVRRELMASVPLSVVIAVLGNTFCGFIGRKALEMPDGMLAALMACNMTGLLLAGPLVGFFQTKGKVKALSHALLLLSAILLTVSLTPSGGKAYRLGAYAFLVQIFLCQIGLSLVTTLRSSIWRSNYPVQYRAKIVVIISLCVTIFGSISIIVYTSAMDHLGLSFKSVYFVSGLMGLFGSYLFSRIQIRRERQTLRNALGSGTGEIRVLAGLKVLLIDGHFRQYMAWQMLNGFATLMIEGIGVVVIVSDVFQSGWLLGGTTLTAVPLLVSGLAGLFWASLFDRSNIFTMRIYGTLFWALSRMVMVCAVFYQSIEIFLLSRIISGVAMGAGQLSWRLGHMAFAPAEKDSVYMGAHVSLTGFRGIIAPFLGIYLYRLDWLGPHGAWLIGLTALCQVFAAWGFYRMGGKVKGKVES